MPAILPGQCNIKLSVQASAFDDEQATMARYLGIEDLSIWIPDDYAYADYVRLTRWADEQGVRIGPCSNLSNHESVVLGLPDRDKVIEQFQESLRAMGRAGLTYRTVSFMATGVVTTSTGSARGGAPTRSFTIGAEHDPALSSVFRTFSFERQYSPDELWENYSIFMRAVVPVAEEAGVRIGIHPEDPPGLTLGNVPRVVASSFEGYKRALEIADSPNVGVCCCLGNLLQGGEDVWGISPIEFVRYFGMHQKLFKVHFRNVSATLPSFHETWPDDGYCDMYEIMKVLREVNNDCYLIADHWPGGKPGRVGPFPGQLYCLGYIRALLERAEADVVDGR